MSHFIGLPRALNMGRLTRLSVHSPQRVIRAATPPPTPLTQWVDITSVTSPYDDAHNILPPPAPLMGFIDLPDVAAHSDDYILSPPCTPEMPLIGMPTIAYAQHGGSLTVPPTPYMACIDLPQVASSPGSKHLTPPPTPYMGYIDLPDVGSPFHTRDYPLYGAVVHDTASNIESAAYYERCAAAGEGMAEDALGLSLMAAPLSDNVLGLLDTSSPHQGAAAPRFGLYNCTSIHEGQPSFLDASNLSIEDAPAFSTNERNARYDILESTTIEAIQKVGLSIGATEALRLAIALLSAPGKTYEEMKAAQKRVCEAAVSQLIDVFSEDPHLCTSRIEEVYLLIHHLLSEDILEHAELVDAIPSLRGFPKGLISMAELLIEDPHISFTHGERTRLIVERFYAKRWMEENFM